MSSYAEGAQTLALLAETFERLSNTAALCGISVEQLVESLEHFIMAGGYAPIDDSLKKITSALEKEPKQEKLEEIKKVTEWANEFVQKEKEYAICNYDFMPTINTDTFKIDLSEEKWNFEPTTPNLFDF